MTPKFRASFSVLSLWESGKWNDAIETYFHLREITNDAMRQGKEFHQKWGNEVNATKKLPEIFNNPTQLKNPKSELKLKVTIQDWLDLVGVIDVLDEPTIYEFKTGKQSSEKYATSKQTGVYGVLATYSGIEVNKAEIYHYDQYKKQADMSVVYLTDTLMQDSLNWLVTISSEMHTYFKDNNLYQRFQKS